MRKFRFGQVGGRGEVAMKRSRLSEQQIAFILHRAEEGVAVEVCRKAGISLQTYHLYGRLSCCKTGMSGWL
jgi:hypothetical protein